MYYIDLLSHFHFLVLHFRLGHETHLDSASVGPIALGVVRVWGSLSPFHLYLEPDTDVQQVELLVIVIVNNEFGWI